MRSVVCPAGSNIVGSGLTGRPGGCLCVIEDHMITTEERHFHVACAARNYHMCPTWRTAKDRDWRDRTEDVARLRHESIERHYGHDPTMDAFMTGDAEPEDLFV